MSDSLGGKWGGFGRHAVMDVRRRKSAVLDWMVLSYVFILPTRSKTACLTAR